MRSQKHSIGSAKLCSVAVCIVVITGCGDSSPAARGAGTVRLVTHESFAMSDAVQQAFTVETGYTLEIVPLGDAGATLNRAILTKDDPLGDVLFGVDSILLSRATNADIFTRYTSNNLESVPESLRPITDQVTPIDRGDVCVIADTAWFIERSLPVPANFDDLRAPAAAKLLVTQDPVSSTPGLAFLLASVDRYGEQWPEFWQDLVDNNVAVAPGWSQAYDANYSAGPGNGDRPLMVSYATSPAADGGRSAVLADTCFGQIEYAGILANASNPKGAAALIDFMLSLTAQNDVAASMYVHPVRSDATVTAEFAQFTKVVDNPRDIEASDIEARREQWIEQWTEIVRP
jgi:thiamine transport system substrate-binding protein